MKYTIILLCFVILYGCSKQTYFSISTNSSNVFYRGVENPFLVTGHNANKVVISCAGCNAHPYISKKDTFGCNITVGGRDTTIMWVSINKRRYEYIYRNKNIPDPVVVILADTIIGGLANETSATNFKTIRFIVPQLWGFDYLCNLKVIKFKMTRIPIHGERESYELTENDLRIKPNAFTNLAKQAESGDVFLFSDITVQFNTQSVGNEKSRMIRDYVIRIK